MKKCLFSPSILAGNSLEYGSEIKKIETSGAEFIHIDVMDGHFVPNLTFGLPLIKEIKKQTKLLLDCHLMITNPEIMALNYVDAGADYLSFHFEAAVHHHRLIKEIQKKNVKAGIAINPSTSEELLKPILPILDFINVMSVNPGFSGQSFIESSVEKIKNISSMLDDLKLKNKVLIEVDGGVSENNFEKLFNAGANIFVMGSYFFNHPNPKIATQNLKEKIKNV